MLRDLLDAYPFDPAQVDEMRAPDGSVRPSWRRFIAGLERMPVADMREREALLRQRVRENGITLNVHADPGGRDRPWLLDPVPLLIDADEWAAIAAGVAQRARLLNAVLADLYGPQTLLAEGLLPPGVVYGQSAYLWPCQGVQPADGVWLQYCGMDLVRGPDGRWCVLADRTQVPAGGGYALENRLLVARSYPELFAELPVAPLGGYFSAARAALVGRAPVAGSEPPLMVLLSPGPSSDSYFEHVYMALHLGFALVEGADLTVRGDRVFLKTLHGLQRVHVILRRQDDHGCDPLELHGDSALGVAGLLGAVRAGQVVVANALGSGLLASPAFLGYLPRIAERLLGEPLRLPSVPSGWCGEAAVRERVLADVGAWVIKPAAAGSEQPPVFGPDLSAAGRGEWAARIAAQPGAYVAQMPMPLARAPSWQDERLQPRRSGLRVFAAAVAQGYEVLTGGLGRVAGDAQTRLLSLQRGGLSKDVWVLSGAARPEPQPAPQPLRRAELLREGPNLSSRAVENLYWTGRYAERLEVAARVARVLLTRLESDPASPTLQVTLALARALEVLPASPGAGVRAALFDPAWPGSLCAAGQNLLGAATRVRERLSLDHWHTLMRLRQALDGLCAATPSLALALAAADRLLTLAASLSGFMLDNMTRDEGWHFLMLGRRIERLAFVARSVAGFLPQGGVAPGAYSGLLELLDSSITYRARYMRPPELLAVVDLAVFDAGNPRSVAHQVRALNADLAALAAQQLNVPAHAVDRCAARLLAFDLDRLSIQPGLLVRRLHALVAAAHQLADRLDRRFFTHTGAEAPQQTLAV